MTQLSFLPPDTACPSRQSVACHGDRRAAPKPPLTYPRAPVTAGTEHRPDPGYTPVTRLRDYGPSALSNAEILGAILQTKDPMRTGELLLVRFKDWGGVARATIQELCGVPGIGQAQAVRLKAAFEAGRRLLTASPYDRPSINSPADAAMLIMMDMSLLEQEELWVLLLDARNRVMDIARVYKGSLHTTVVRTAELFRPAIRHNAAGVIIAHNHPSGDPSPSPEDVRLTEQCVQAGRLVDIDVLDHLVIGASGRYVSLKERGLGFPG